EQPLIRLDVDLGSDVALTRLTGAAVILSPDGKRILYVSRSSGGSSQLYTRRLDQPRAAPLSGAEGAESPFFSPDGQWVAFFAGGKLKKIAVEGGAAVTLCDAANGRGGSWGDNGEIVAALGSREGLSRVSAAGGPPAPLTKLDPAKKETSHRWPQILPGGKAVLFVAGAAGRFEQANIEALSLDAGQRKILQRGGTYGRYLPSGHLVWVHEGTLFAAPMDASRLELRGPSTPVLEDVLSAPFFGGAQYAFSMTGTLVYQSGQPGGEWSVQWLESDGSTQPLLAKMGGYVAPAFSPDGRRLALSKAEGGNIDIWICEWERGALTRLTSAPGVDNFPVWAPDGKHIAYSSGGVIFWVRADGSGGPHKLMESRNRLYPSSFTPDGRHLAFTEDAPETRYDIWTAPLEGHDSDQPRVGKPELFLRTPFSERYPAFSPDGRWLAYESDESGAHEVYVRPFPAGGGKWQVSTGGGVMPVWSPNGRELFYRAPDSRIMVAGYAAKGDTFAPGRPRPWSEKRLAATTILRDFALAPDGKRFAVLLQGDGADQKLPHHVTFLENFF
ncbi:MAG: hypothetical protein AAB225_30905, partial [Acidobacteriota bacterium]